MSVSETCQHPAGLPGFVRHLPRGGSAAAYVTVSESGVKSSPLPNLLFDWRCY